jgi:hypothetical protein
MKKNYIFIFTLFLSFNVFSQVETLNLNRDLVNPIGIAVKNNLLFIGEAGSSTFSKTDLSQGDPKSVVDINTNLIFIADMIFDGNILYFSSADNSGSIYKLDITDSSNTITTVVTNLGTNPSGLAIHGSELYIALRLHKKILKIDVTDTNPTPVEVVSNVSGNIIIDLAIHQDYLYFTHTNRISRIDITQTTPIVELFVDNLNGPNGLELYENFLLIALSQNSSSGKKIGMIDLNDSNPVVQDLAVDLDDAWNLAIEDNTLYIAEQVTGKVSTLNISTLSNDDFSDEKVIVMYPNPSSDFITISNLKSSVNYTVADLSGRVVLKSNLSQGESIDIRSLSKGVYLIHLENYSNTYKIVKN